MGGGSLRCTSHVGVEVWNRTIVCSECSEEVNDDKEDEWGGGKQVSELGGKSTKMEADPDLVQAPHALKSLERRQAKGHSCQLVPLLDDDSRSLAWGKKGGRGWHVMEWVRLGIYKKVAPSRLIAKRRRRPTLLPLLFPKLSEQPAHYCGAGASCSCLYKAE